MLRQRRPRALATAALLLTAAAALGACTGTTDGTLAGGPASGSSAGSAPGTAGAGTPTVGRADFTDCSDNFNLSALGLPADVQKRLTFDCASVKVPLDYTRPGGKKISVAMVRVHDTTVKPIGSLVMNPGGPGASGIELALGVTPQLTGTLLKHFDLVGFDPRGVGSSTPVTCLTDAQKDAANALSPDIRTSAGFAEAKKAAAATASACEKRYGADLPYFDTVNTARDMDLVRQAVGDAKLNYLGFSYGTELGAQYLHLFPKNMRVAVLDGAVDPLTDDTTSFANQLVGFEQAFDQFAAYCTKTAPCSAIGVPRAAVASVVAKANTGALKGGEGRTVTSALVVTGVLESLYSQSYWSTLGAALKAALGGDGSQILSLADQYYQRYDGKYTNLSDANLTIACNDSTPGPTDSEIRTTAASWVTRFPIFGLSSAASLFACQSWQPKRSIPPLPTATTTPTKVLVIGNLHDPATPYQGAKNLAKTLGNAELLTWDGEGHTSYLQGSSCIDAKVNAYLIDQTLPAENTTCPR